MTALTMAEGGYKQLSDDQLTFLDKTLQQQIAGHGMTLGEYHKRLKFIGAVHNEMVDRGLRDDEKVDLS